jgi:hypothetical protein
MSDLATQLAALRTLRQTVTDSIQGAALDALIASLEAQLLPFEPPAENIGSCALLVILQESCITMAS